MIPSLSRRCLLCLSISRFLMPSSKSKKSWHVYPRTKWGCVQLSVFAPGWSLISPKQECGAARLRNKSIEPAWEIWSLYTLSGPARWSRQQSSCLRLFPPGSFVDLHLAGSLAYTSKLANSAAESPTREGRHAPINYKPLSHGYQTWKASPNRTNKNATYLAVSCTPICRWNDCPIQLIDCVNLHDRLGLAR